MDNRLDGIRWCGYYKRYMNNRISFIYTSVKHFIFVVCVSFVRDVIISLTTLGDMLLPMRVGVQVQDGCQCGSGCGCQ